MKVSEVKVSSHNDAEQYIGRQFEEGKCIGITSIPKWGMGPGIYLVISSAGEQSTYHRVSNENK
jgi:hypothetical protein